MTGSWQRRCVLEERENDKECIAEYDNKKEVISKESAMKKDNEENTCEILIEKSKVSTENEMTYSGAKVSKEESCDETKEESVSDSVSENRVGNVDDEYEDLSYIESSTSSQANLIYNHQE